MTKEVKSAETTAPMSIELLNNVNLSDEVRENIAKKAQELKTKHALRKVFVVVVEGEDGDEKPFYIAYLRRPSLIHFSQYMTFVQKDLIQANKMLASNVFLEGDRELVDDDDLFLYGTMQQLNSIIDSRNSDLVKR